MKGRLFNYRPLCVMFASLILGSLFACWIEKWTTLIISIIIICVIICLTLSIVKRKWQYFVLPIVTCCLGVGIFHVAEQSFYKNNANNTPNEIQTRINSIERPNDDYLVVMADNCLFDGKKNDDTIKVYIYDKENLYSNIKVGSIIKFSPKNFYKNDLKTEDGMNSSFYAENCKYTVTVNMENITILKTQMTPDELFRSKIKNNLSNGLTNQNVELVYSALFGDKEFLSQNVYDGFKLSGVVHLLAVSGLHVGILVGILMFVLKLFKAKPLFRLITISIVLLFYVYLCGFSVSVVRASIMAIILLMAPIFFAEYDSLSSLSFAGIILYLVNPFVVFDVGFVLSFSCVFGIIMFNKPINKSLEKLKMPKAITNSMSISASTTIALIIPMAYYFNNLNTISILANIILIPIFAIGFTFAFILGILSLIAPFITYILVVLNPLFDFVSIIAKVLGDLPIANFSTIDIPIISIAFYLVMLLSISCLNVSKQKTKILISLPLVAILIVGMVAL